MEESTNKKTIADFLTAEYNEDCPITVIWEPCSKGVYEHTCATCNRKHLQRGHKMLLVIRNLFNCMNDFLFRCQDVFRIRRWKDDPSLKKLYTQKRLYDYIDLLPFKFIKIIKAMLKIRREFPRYYPEHDKRKRWKVGMDVEGSYEMITFPSDTLLYNKRRGAPRDE